VAVFHRALEIQPNSPEAHNNLGNAYRAQSKFSEAVASFRQAIRIQPAYLGAWNNLGLTFQEQGQFAEAMESFSAALRIHPDHPESLFFLGNVLRDQGRLEEAMVHYQQALRRNPNHLDALLNLGRMLKERGRIDESVECYQRLLQVDPNHAEAHHQLGNSLKERGRFEEAVRCYDRSLEIEPSVLVRYTRAIALPVIYSSIDELRRCRERLTEALGEMLREGIDIDPMEVSLPSNFYLAYQGENDRQIQEMIARLCAACSRDFTQNRSKDQSSDEKIRIGFLSSYLRDHTIGLFWRGLITNLCRSKFSVTVFALEQFEDSTAHQIEKDADQYIRLARGDVQMARERIVEKELDILFYTDIGMNPMIYALALLRMAPVQCVTWGHPVTTGLPTMDYFISSKLLEIDEAEDHYTEELVRLETLGIHYFRPQFPMPRKQRSDFGLPDEKNLYACLQSAFKFHPEYDELLANILRSDPNGVVVLTDGMQPHWGELLKQRFQKSMPDVAKRIMFLPWQNHDDYMRLNHVVDVLLLPPQFGGGRTSYEALSLGVPIVTLPSRLLRGRITYALYRQLGVLDCVAETPEEYVNIAVRLGRDADYRAAIGEKILANSDRLFEDTESVRELERFFQQAVESRRKGS